MSPQLGVGGSKSFPCLYVYMYVRSALDFPYYKSFEIYAQDHGPYKKAKFDFILELCPCLF
jgi:hypothetical protein